MALRPGRQRLVPRDGCHLDSSGRRVSVHLKLRDLRLCKSSARVSEGARGHNPRLGASIERRRQPYEDVVRMKSAATDLRSGGKALGKSINPGAATGRAETVRPAE